MILGANLRHLRKECMLTQKQVADMLKIDRSAYTYYETGKSQPSIENLLKLSKIFCVTVDSLLGMPTELFGGDPTKIFIQDSGAPESHANLIYTEADARERSLLGSFRMLNQGAQQQVLDLIEQLKEQEHQ